MDDTGKIIEMKMNGVIPFYADILNIINEYFPLRNCIFFFLFFLRSFKNVFHKCINIKYCNANGNSGE